MPKSLQQLFSWPPKCLCRRGILSHSLTGQTQPTPALVSSHFPFRACRILKAIGAAERKGKTTPAQIAFGKRDPTKPGADSFSILKAICAGVGWAWLARIASHARFDTEAFLVETAPRAPGSKFITGSRFKVQGSSIKPYEGHDSTCTTHEGKVTYTHDT